MEKKSYILGSHNSWSFLKPTKWWMKLIAFTAKCQKHSIAEQYWLDGVTCFDLHIRFDELGNVKVVHGPVEYDLEDIHIEEYFKWANDQKDSQIYIRIILDVRSRKAMYQYGHQREYFQKYCEKIEKIYPNVIFWCGRMVTGWAQDYKFKNEPTCQESYASVCSPKFIDDLWPWIFAKKHNRIIKNNGTNADILLIDFVDIK
jgi:hypothetical protein